MTYDDVMALGPTLPDNLDMRLVSSLDYAKRFVPGSRTVTIWYGRIPNYRDPKRKSWGFAISDESATWAWYNRYTCPRRSAKRVFNAILKKDAEERGFVVNLVVQPDCGLDADLTMKSRSTLHPNNERI